MGAGTDTGTIDFVAPADNVVGSPNAQNVTADPNVSATVVITVTDSNNQPIANRNIQFAIVSPANSSAKINSQPPGVPATLATGPNGQASFQISDATVEDVTWVATEE